MNKYIKTLKRKDNKYIIELSDPFEYGKERVTQLEITEPKAKHIRQMPASPKTDDMLKIIGQLCGQPDSAIDELSLRDVAKLTDFFEAFS
ncbi:MAG: phage tail assembly protein [Proteobacteria bacterium]|nr:phage tail assembly protein [Pseudomonadota bacterium]